ncbi:MAG: hypothetical protein ABR78_01200 [Acidimicrobiia bacterium BACL6 MAG-120910-bin40]|jgi:hypothetical protein|nr:MAG: hypothetical protein ABR78_01200 [Acidimicrobiia bacterium BACL6 MAG-120910-bin40]
MTHPTLDVTNTPQRNRLTVAFRAILAIPHAVVLNIWDNLIQIVAVIQWFIILFTGKRNKGIWTLQNSWLSYAARVESYGALLYDKWPSFGEPTADDIIRYSFEYKAEASRASNFFRIILVIPAFFVYIFLVLCGIFVAVVSWFAILFTGRHSQGMFNFLLKVTRYSMSIRAYMALMTDEYPTTRVQPAAIAPRPATNWAPPTV